MQTPLDKALAQLTPIEQAAWLEAAEKQLRETQYAKFWEATPKQQEQIGQFKGNIKVFGILGGNRSGKTELGAFIANAWAMGKEWFKGSPAWEYVKDMPIPEPPNNIWVVGLDFPTLRDVIFREKLLYGRNHPAIVPKIEGLTKREGDFQIFYPNGSIVTGKSADSGREKFQGASIDLVWIDEECEAGVFDECYQRTADCAGKLLLTLTPLVDVASAVREPWVFDLYQDWKQGRKDICFVKLSVLDNPYVPEEEKQRLRDKWAGHYEERARLYGDFIQRSGLVYNLWDKGRHTVKPFRIPREWRRVVSIDPAATGTTAAIWAAIEPGTNNVILYREYYEKDLIVSEHAKNILAMTGGESIDMWLIDPKWGSQRNNETHKTGMQLYRENNIPVRLAQVGPDWGLNESREYVAATVATNPRHPKLLVFEDMHNFIFEIEHYVYDFYARGEMKGLSKDKPLKRNDHLMNAMQYLVCQKPRGRRNNLGALDRLQREEQSRLNSY